ncbi:MAG: hypothetical protein IPL96_17245 [Holophagaceae bacterium]|nr:hypothetical protein [Holophagaceae bacterium]
MGTGAIRNTTLFTGPRRCSQAGFSLAETVLTLAIAGSLALGFCATDLERNSLTAAQTELRTTLDQAFMLAHHKGNSIKVMVKRTGATPVAPDVLPLQLPNRVKWGSLPGVPLPKGMDDPDVADQTGEAHATITVSPRHTATATTWFLNDGREVVCMRLSGKGRLTLLRWKKDARTWGKA